MWNWLFNMFIGFLLPLYQVTNAICPLCVGPPPPPSSAKVAIQVEVSHSFSSSPSQTDPLPTYTDAESQAQLTASAPTTTTTPTLDPPAFNWSEDATAIPIIPMFTKNRPRRDLSALRTSNPNPFSSLSCRNCHSQLPFENHHISVSWPPFQSCWAPPHLSVSQITTHQWSIPISAPAAPLPSTMALDWESDPRLTDLSCAV